MLAPNCLIKLLLFTSLLQVSRQVAPAELSTELQADSGQNTGATNVSSARSEEARNSPYYFSEEDLPPPPSEEADEPSNESDLNYSLMNAPQDKLQAVKHLLNTHERSIGLSEKNPSVHQMQCTHKGLQYSHGQTVPIEDQPCLNCTCRRAILQCYLRVCPPVAPSHEKRQASQAGKSCHLVREPSQCCPITKCEPISALNATGEEESRAPASVAINLNHVAPTGQPLSTTEQRQSDTSVIATPSGSRKIKPNEDYGDLQRTRQQHDQQPSNRSMNEQQSAVMQHKDPNQLPKLTVINGLSGQRDSILLITSNPNGAHGAVKSHRDNSSSATGEHQPSNVLLDALLEAVYSSAAQMNGLNLQGSCMINGSLYVEGSAVIPEGSAYCQYCYCIRQKIMCVKPKCHLYISGCTPKYTNEYACCPTSYSCSASPPPPTTIENGAHSGLSTYSGRPGAAALSEKLSAAIESISRATNPHMSMMTMANNSADLEVSPRQADGASNPDIPMVSSAMAALMEALNMATARPEPQSITTTPPPSTSSTASPITASASTTVQPEPASNLTTSDSEENDEEGDDDAAAEPMGSTTRRPQPGKPKKNKNPSTTEHPSSVSDFLEPMNKLGPLVMNVAGQAGCMENGRQYAIGEQIPTLESCKHCYCGPEGLKECKMIECSLKISHNCKPIIPEDHCCPIRYDCPSSQSDATSSDGRSREPDKYRGESIEPDNFDGLSRCGKDGNCPELNSVGNGNLTATQVTDSIADIAGLTDTTPLVKSTRIVDEQAVHETPEVAPNTTRISSASLQDELNKFIMQINHLNASLGPDYPLVGEPATGKTPAGPLLVQHYAPLPIQQTQNASAISAADYHSVQAPLTQVPPIPKGMIGIPSIEPVDEFNILNVSRAEIYPALSVSGGSRDSRSTTLVDGITRTLRPVVNAPTTEPVRTSARAEDGSTTTGVPDGYGDTLAGMNDSTTSNTREGPANLQANEEPQRKPLPHVRLSREHQLPPAGSRASGEAFGVGEGVLFDDEPHVDNSSNSSSESTGSNLRINFNSSDRINIIPLSTNNSQPGDDERSRVSELTTQSPLQPTTGTPIGLEAERTQETNGWLKSLSGMMASFGRRLVSGSDLQQASAVVGSPVQYNGQIKEPKAVGETARSQQSLLNQLLRNMLASVTTSRPLVMRPLDDKFAYTSTSSVPKKTVEPLARLKAMSPYDTTPTINVNPSPSSAPAELEIITAAMPVDPEVSGVLPTLKSSATFDGTNDLIVLSSSLQHGDGQFARRSEAGDVEDVKPEARSIDDTDQSNGVRFFASISNASIPKPQQSAKVLTCFDPLAQRTYQPNEIIPKGDPCKTCTCVLGSEMCQTLICPEKPAEDCREERRPGECCPNYLCSSNVTNLTSSSTSSTFVAPTTSEPCPSCETPSEETPSPRTSGRSFGKLVASTAGFGSKTETTANPNVNIARFVGGNPLLQRAMNVESDQSSGMNSLSVPVAKQLQQQQMQFNNNQRQLNLRIQLPQHPIRTSELASLLPSHLRFRPSLASGQGGQFQAEQMQNKPTQNVAFPKSNGQQMQKIGGASQSFLIHGSTMPTMHLFGSPGRGFMSNQFQQQVGNGARVDLHRSGQSGNSPNNSGNQVRPQILMHPVQRSQASPSSQPHGNLLNFIGVPGATSEQVLSMNTQPNNWRSSAPVENSQPMLPTNILIPRMSVAHGPVNNMISDLSSSPQLSSSSWQPSRLPQTQVNPHETSPVSTQEASSTAPSLAAENASSGSTPLSSPTSMPANLVVSPREVLKPIADPVVEVARTGGNHREFTSPSSTIAMGSMPTNNPSVNFNSAPPTHPSASPPEAVSLTTETTPSSQQDMATTVSLASIAESSSKGPTESALSTSEPVQEPTKPSKEASSPQEAETAKTTTEPPPAPEDPFGLFTVSECNIYGKLYKVGQSIEELSDQCKRCQCTRSGVECKSHC